MSNARVSLDVIDVRQPCPSDWNAMAGDDRSRFCAGCGLHVHNLSAMSRDEAERLVCEAAGRLCIRFGRTPAGAVRTLDYAKPVARRGWRFWTGLGGLGALAAMAISAIAGRPSTGAGGGAVGMMMMGDIYMPPAVVSPEPLGPPTPDGAGGGSAQVIGEMNPSIDPLPVVPQGPPAPQ